MSRERILIILGFLVIIAPFCGVPNSWLLFILPVLGILIIVISFTLRRKRIQNLALDAEIGQDSF